MQRLIDAKERFAKEAKEIKIKEEAHQKAAADIAAQKFLQAKLGAGLARLEVAVKEKEEADAATEKAEAGEKKAEAARDETQKKFEVATKMRQEKDSVRDKAREELAAAEAFLQVRPPSHGCAV